MNWIAIFTAALIPIFVGLVWYSDKVFGTTWMKLSNLKKEELEKSNMLPILAFCYLFSLFLAVMMSFVVIHQTGAIAMVGGDAANGSETFTAFMAEYGTAFRTFKHGALHGTLAGIMFALPIIAINALFERKSWKYIFIHAGYWTVTLGIMGAIICGWI